MPAMAGSRSTGARGLVARVAALGAVVALSACDAPPSSLTPAGGRSPPPACRAPAGRTTLDDGSNGPVAWTWISGDQVLYSTASAGIWAVPLAGGAATQIAVGAAGVGVVAGTLYYTAAHAAGSPSSDGKQPSATALYAAPFKIGRAHV